MRPISTEQPPDEPDAEVVRLLHLGTGGSAPPRRWPWVVGALVVLAAVGIGVGVALRPAAVAEVTTVLVERGPFVETVSAVGPVQPRREVAVASEISGIVSSVEVEANDPVEAGQVLARLDTTMLDAELARVDAMLHAAEANVRQAEAQRALAADRVDRTARLGNIATEEARTAGKLELSAAVAGLEAARANVASARASREASAIQLSKAVITAPVAGVVLERHVEPGQAVVSALQAATLFRLAEDLEHLTVDLEIDEADVGKLSPGDAVTFTVAAWPGRTFEGVLRHVTLAPQSVSSVVLYEAVVDVDNADGALRPGMTATATVQVATHQDVAILPLSALRYVPEEPPVPAPEGDHIWVVDGDSVRPVSVRRLATEGVRVAVEADLPAGTAVLLPTSTW